MQIEIGRKLVKHEESKIYVVKAATLIFSLT